MYRMYYIKIIRKSIFYNFYNMVILKICIIDYQINRITVKYRYQLKVEIISFHNCRINFIKIGFNFETFYRLFSTVLKELGNNKKIK